MKRVVLHEVGLRDGLQMEKKTVPKETKLTWIDKLLSSGIDVLQIGSFVHPEKVPQMADTDELFQTLRGRPKLARPVLSGLVLNERGLERGLACGVELFCLGVSASETHSKKNTGMGIHEATRRIIAMALEAKRAGFDVQVSIQSAFGCGFEGEVPDWRVVEIARSYVDAGLTRISLADTAGHAYPDQVERLFSAILGLDASVEAACHFHDTYGLGMANLFAALGMGVVSFESSVAGLGGCPFTKMAAGNVPTEDVVHSFQRMGLRTDVNLASLIEVAKDVSTFFGREMPGRIYKSGPLPYVASHLLEVGR
jgi:hydroxymethylglutaryl-CoA lyase